MHAFNYFANKIGMGSNNVPSSELIWNVIPYATIDPFWANN